VGSRRNLCGADTLHKRSLVRPGPRQVMKGFREPAFGKRVGFSFGRRSFPLSGTVQTTCVSSSGAYREAETWEGVNAQSCHSRPDRPLDSSARDSSQMRNPSRSKQKPGWALSNRAKPEGLLRRPRASNAAAPRGTRRATLKSQKREPIMTDNQTAIWNFATVCPSC
jgi:hypothetical protein